VVGSTPVTGFVQNVQVRLLRQGSGDKRTPLLPTGELANLATSQLVNARQIQRVFGGGGVGPTGRAQPAGAAVATHQDHVAHGDRERPVHGLSLRQVGDTQRLPNRWLAQDSDGAGPGVAGTA
jgi:hypothetical protein